MSLPDRRPSPAAMSRKEGWFAFADRPKAVAPEKLTRSALRKLSCGQAGEYAAKRLKYLSGLTIRTPQLLRVHESIGDMLSSDLQDFDRVRGAPVIDAEPGVGKTTAVNMFGGTFHREVIAREGPMVGSHAERIPVVRIGLTGNTTPKSLILQILEFYGHPNRSGTTLQVASSALDCVLQCETQLIIIDDIHFLNLNRRDGREVSNTLKSLANDFPSTFIFVGVGVEEQGLFREGLEPGASAAAQLGRRWTRLEMPAFRIFEEQQREDWRVTLKEIEKGTVLVDTHPGMIADDLSDYFFARTSGYIGSMMELARMGAHKAIKNGSERITKDLLDSVHIALAAEKRRQELEAAMKSGKLHSLPKKTRPAAATELRASSEPKKKPDGRPRPEQQADSPGTGEERGVGGEAPKRPVLGLVNDLGESVVTED